VLDVAGCLAGQRLPAQILPGEIADWYDELTEHGYLTQVTVQQLVAVGQCHRCGTQVETMAEERRRTAHATCPATGCAARVVCRWKGERRPRTVVKQHPHASGSTLGDIHAILRGAFRFGVQRGWLAMGENPMTFVERRTDQHVMQRPPSPEEVRRALAATLDHHDPNLHPLLACLADTGARLSEALVSTAVWKFARGQGCGGGRCSCQALGSARYRPQAQSKASSGSPMGRPLGSTESW
jgi:hypothetical protein